MKTATLFILAGQFFASALMAQDWVAVAPSGKKILVDNDHVRMIEVTIQPGGEEPEHTHPQYIEYVLEPARILVTYKGKEPKVWNTEPKAYSGDPKPPHAMKNIDSKPYRCILIEFKDKPYIELLGTN